MADGWIKVHWKLKASLVGTSAVATGVWVHLLLRASRRRVVLNNGTTLDTGELLINERGLASELEVSRKVLRRLIDLFESEGMVEVLKRDRNGTKLSVCNWRTYQELPEPVGPIPNRNVSATEPQRDRNEPQSEIPNKPKSPKNPIEGCDSELDRIESFDLRVAARSWVEYKAEKRQRYKPQGLKALVTTIVSKAVEQGEKATVADIVGSMGDNYQGIVWGKYAARGSPAKPQKQSFDVEAWVKQGEKS